MNLEIQRRAVVIAIRRVDQTREELNKPPEPTATGEPGAFSPTTALNLLTALSDLRSSQNNFMSVWLNYQAARMTLMRELGVMEIDENGMWVDLPPSDAPKVPREGASLPPPVPDFLFEVTEPPGPMSAPSPEELPGKATAVSFEATAMSPRSPRSPDGRQARRVTCPEPETQPEAAKLERSRL